MGGRGVGGKGGRGGERLLDEEAVSGVVNPGKWIRINDLTPTIADLPRDTRVARGLHEGRFDTWNPQVACGVPLWAEQGGPLFPLKLVFYLFPSVGGYNLFRILRLLVAALGAFVLLRRRGL